MSRPSDDAHSAPTAELKVFKVSAELSTARDHGFPNEAARSFLGSILPANNQQRRC